MASVVRLSCNRLPGIRFLNVISKSSIFDSRSNVYFCKNHNGAYSISTKPVLKNVENDQKYFGFERVSAAEKSRKVQSVFSNVASNYDLMNDIMSAGIHRLWKDYLIQILDPLPTTKLLDVACGTGDISFRFLKAIDYAGETPNDRILSPMDEIVNEHDSCLDVNNSEKVVMIDINQEMLKVCKSRARHLGFHKGYVCLQGDAEALPVRDSLFDAYTIAFGIRNVVHVQQALNEAYRVLRPGGRFLCLEFSQVTNPLFSRFYDLYSFQVIPVVGQLVAGSWSSYQYLVESIRKFPNQEEFGSMIEEAGFCMVSFENLLNGVAAIHSGYKI